MNHKEDEDFKQRRHDMIAHKIAWICVYIVMLILVSRISDIMFNIILIFIDVDLINIVVAILFLIFPFYAAWWITHHFLGKYSWG